MCLSAGIGTGNIAELSSGGRNRSLENPTSSDRGLAPSLEQLHNRLERLLAIHGCHTIQRDEQCDLQVVAQLLIFAILTRNTRVLCR